MPEEETMDVEEQIRCLNAALRLQHRSVLNYSLAAGSVIGLEFQAHADKMREHSLSELEDATRLVEKIAALGGEPTTEVAPLEFVTDPAEALDRLIDAEGEARSKPCRLQSSRLGARPPRRRSSTGSST